MTMGGDVGRGWDFFISYTQADRPWAEWIAWILEEDGHHVLIQAWDFVPGSNWIRGMEAGTRDAARTIAVLSDAYLKSVYGSSEWQAAVAGDPTGTGRKLLVVRVALCEPAGLLAGVVRVDLFGVTEAAAKTRLRDMVAAAAVGRAKPSVPPRFPGGSRAVPTAPEFPGVPLALTGSRPASSSVRHTEPDRPASTAATDGWRRGAAMISCPYCYSRLVARQIQFRCSGSRGRLGRSCELTIDTVMWSRTGNATPQGPIFAADGRANKAECPKCKGETTIRICPICHHVLPVDFGNVNSRLIALVGAKEAGKTVFMTVLVHELMGRVGSRFDAAIACADERTRERFTADYESPIYQHGRLLAPTTTSHFPREPLIFRFTIEKRRRIGTAGPQHTLISFVDTAGEDLTIQRSGYEYVRYLTAADGIVLLLDPLQMPDVRELAKPGTLLPSLPVPNDPALILERINDVVIATGGPKRKIGKPLAIALTKMDALDHNLKDNSPLRRPAPEMPFFDETDSQEVHAEILRLLTRWDRTRIDQIISKHYQRYRYFGLSALGETPTQDYRISERGIQPYRIADPLLWMLGEFGAIRARKGS
jgi:hypothetical protein